MTATPAPPSHDEPKYAAATVAVTAGRPARDPGAAVNEAVWLTSTYVANGPVDYGRTDNRTWQAFEQTLGALEGGSALVYSAGMAAIAAVVALVPDGSVVVAPRHAYSGTGALLREAVAAGRLTVREVDVADVSSVAAAVEGAQLVWLESPTNPMLEVADIRVLADAARAAGAISVVDSTFAGPLVQRPLDLGADVVVHSVTKYLAGHSDVVLGATVTRDDDAGRALYARLRTHRHLHGAIAGPQEVFLALRGMRTLAVRVERAQANAAELARRLVDHPAVERVRHPSLPSDPGTRPRQPHHAGFRRDRRRRGAGRRRSGRAGSESTRLWVHATSLGGVESSLERRRRYPVEAQTVPEALLRLSVGIEDVEDLWADLDQALRA
jgi:cystathionine gamma-synthase